jgi:hypothetical protein
MINLYNAELTLMCNEHNMFHQMDDYLRLTDHLTEEDFVMLKDSWDDKFKQCMLHSENKISKFMMGHIEWNPTIGNGSPTRGFSREFVFGCKDKVSQTLVICFAIATR